MKGLKKFLKFDTAEFFADKELILLGQSPLYSYVENKRTENVIGTKLEVVISVDNTDYGSNTSNVFEKITIKLIGDNDFYIEPMTKISVVNFTKALVYGEYNNNISLETNADSIMVISE